MNHHISDELANKVHQLSKVLNQAEKIICILEDENTQLKKLLDFHKINREELDRAESLILSY